MSPRPQLAGVRQEASFCDVTVLAQDPAPGVVARASGPASVDAAEVREVG